MLVKVIINFKSIP